MALINSPPRYRCTCANGFANGVCGYPFIAEYAAECTVYTGGVCDVDVDECSSSPCANRCGNATKEMMRLLSNPTYMSSLWFRNCNPKPLRAHSGSCTDSTTAYRPPSCGGTDDGNGTACATNASSTGCVVDGGDCLFAGCTPGGCTVAGWNNTIPVDRFSCACAAGFADGICAYDYIAEYAAQCDVALGGRCQLDVDECVSAPCSNGATCLESGAEAAVPAHAFRCDCASGYTNGNCVYDYIAEYTARCSVLAGGRCDVDVNECDSNPCGAHADACLESVDLTERSLLFSEYMEGSSR